MTRSKHRQRLRRMAKQAGTKPPPEHRPPHHPHPWPPRPRPPQDAAQQGWRRMLRDWLLGPRLAI